MKNLGPRVKKFRTQRQLSGRALASYLGISNAHVSDIENGKAKPSIDLLVVLANYFGCSADYLLGLTDDPSPADVDSQIQMLYEKLSLDRRHDALLMMETWLLDESDDYQVEWMTRILDQFDDPRIVEYAGTLLEALGADVDVGEAEDAKEEVSNAEE